MKTNITTGAYVEANLFNFDGRREDMESTPEEMYTDPDMKVRGVLVVIQLGDRTSYRVLQSDNDTGYKLIEPDTIVVLEDAPSNPQVDLTRIFGENVQPESVTLL